MKFREWMKSVYPVYWLYYKTNYELKHFLHGRNADEIAVRKKYADTFGKEISLDNPVTLNEKINWLKLREREPFHTICADKYRAREIWKCYGEDGLVPLLFQTYDWRNVTKAVIPDEPCVIKSNSGSGTVQIIRDKEDLDIRALRAKCRRWMLENSYYMTQEWQYKDIKRCIIIEKLLLDKNGKLPNDYKLHFFNGNLQFIYCSIDREGENYRSIYTPDWKRLDCEWVGRGDHKGMVGNNIEKPATFERMVEIGADISKKFKYVRVDFYDLDGKLYYGEITLHHGSGFDTFEPKKWDYELGKKLDLGRNGVETKNGKK